MESSRLHVGSEWGAHAGEKSIDKIHGVSGQVKNSIERGALGSVENSYRYAESWANCKKKAINNLRKKRKLSKACHIRTKFSQKWILKRQVNINSKC